MGVALKTKAGVSMVKTPVNPVLNLKIDITVLTEKAERNLEKPLQACSGFVEAVRRDLLVSFLVLVVLAGTLYYLLNSFLFTVLFLIFSVPIMGGSVAWSLKRKINELYGGISGVIHYIPQVIGDISQAQQQASGVETAEVSKISAIAIEMVIYTVIKRWAGTNWLRNRMVTWLQRPISSFKRSVEKEFTGEGPSCVMSRLMEKLEQLSTNSLRVLEVSFNSIKLVLNAISIIAFGLGGLLILVLAGIRMWVRF